ncbi:MAG: hypothetical protein N2691_01395 [Patescibacteria group bacterium]|nr:hypothetical protein [Patescibacteria group bacterium]
MKIYRPDRAKLGRFLIPPLIFTLLASGFIVAVMGLHIGALLTALLIGGVVLTPFLVFILPTFLREQVIIEDFTSRIYLVVLVFRIKRVLTIADIDTIRERYRADRKSGPRELVITQGKKTVMISESKYRYEDILDMVQTYKQKNPRIRVSLLD